MKDFDQFFRKRLEGERPFSKRDDNWKQLSRRLDAFDTGLQNTGHTVRHWPKLLWQAAAFTAAAATAWMGWQNQALRTENAGLREQVALSAPAPTAIDSLATAPFPTVVPAPETAVPIVAETAPNQKFDNTHSLSPSNIAAQPSVQEGLGDASGEALRTQRTPKQSQQKPASEPTRPATDPKQSMANQTASPPSPAQPAPAEAQKIVDSTAFAASGARDSAALVRTAVQPDLLSLPSAELQALETPKPKLPELATEPIATQAPKPIRPVTSPPRLRAGIQAVAGMAMPKEEGVSLLTGQGLLAEVRVFKGFWVGASADWLRYEIQADKNPARFHLPPEPHFDPPGGGPGPHPHDDYELKKVESEQRQQRFAAQVRYALPVRGWLRPSVHLAHVWTHQSAAFVSYYFEEDNHGGPNPNPNYHDPMYFTKKSDGQWFKNTWRLGAGLEVNVKNWAFGLSADYDKSFVSDEPSFDALLVRAGATYQF